MTLYVHGAFMDSWGLAVVRVFEERAEHWAQEYENFECKLPENSKYLVVGGGAEGTQLPAGALLTASYPSDDLNSWIASSKAHSKWSGHKLRVFAIGLRIKGVSKEFLRSQIKIVKSTSQPLKLPEAHAVLPAGYCMLGGGASVDWRSYGDYGNLLTVCRPSKDGIWEAKSKNHKIDNPATITSYAIGIGKEFDTGDENDDEIISWKTISDRCEHMSTFSGEPRTTCRLREGFALTGVGAFVDWEETKGSLLWMMRPTTQATIAESEIASKQHTYRALCTATAYSIGIQVTNNDPDNPHNKPNPNNNDSNDDDDEDDDD